MRLKYLELHNYRRFEDCRLEFPEGVVGIVGTNGSGKSSLIESISWALYGNESQIVRTGKDGIRSSFAGDNDECSVKLEFDLEGDSYLLERTMRGRGLSMRASLSVNDHLEAEGDRAVTQAIIARMGMDHKAFLISVYAKQKDLDSLSTLRPHERKRLVLRLLDVDVLDRVVSDIDGDARELSNELKGLETSLRDEGGGLTSDRLKDERSEVAERLRGLGSTIADAEKGLEGLDLNVDASRIAIETMGGLERNHRELQRTTIERRSTLEATRDHLRRLVTEIERLEGRKEELAQLFHDSEEYGRLVSVKRNMDAQMRLYEQRKGTLKRLEEARGRLWELDNELADDRERLEVSLFDEDRLGAVEESLTATDSEIGELREIIAAMRVEITQKVSEMGEVAGHRTDVASLGPDSLCPMCERPLGHHHDGLLAKLSVQESGLNEELTSLRDRIATREDPVEKLGVRREALLDRRSQLQEEALAVGRIRFSIKEREKHRDAIMDKMSALDEEVGSMGEPMFSEEGYAQIMGRMEELVPRAERHTILSTELTRLPELVREVSSLHQKIATLETEIGKLEVDISEIGFDENALKDSRSNHDELVQRRDADRIELYALRSRREVDMARLASLDEQLARLGTLEDGSRRGRMRLQRLQTLSQAMRDFKDSIMARIVPSLSRIASELFVEMTDARYGGLLLNEEYDVSVYDGGALHPLARFSGGESDLANLCLRLAISRVIADRSGSDINLLMLDEIFGSLDQTRKRNVMETLNHLSRHFRQIFLITHIEDVKDLMGHVIMVRESDDGRSHAALDV